MFACCCDRRSLAQFEVLPSGVLKYANNSAYKSKGQDVIRKLVTVSPAVVAELKRIIVESEVTKEDDNNWPEPDVVGEQNLEIKIGNEHISFTCAKISSMCVPPARSLAGGDDDALDVLSCFLQSTAATVGWLLHANGTAPLSVEARSTCDFILLICVL